MGVAHYLREFGHDIHFGIVKQWIEAVTKYNFQVEVYVDPNVAPGSDPQANWGEWMRKNCHKYRLSPLEKQKSFNADAFDAFHKFTRNVNTSIEQIINKIKPDLILIDFYVTVPAVVKSGIPWALIWSCNPVFVYQIAYNGPPAFSGYSPKDDKKLFSEFNETVANALEGVKKERDEWLQSLDIEIDGNKQLIVTSPYLNIYIYPKNVDYEEIAPVPEKWHRVDHALRPLINDKLDIDKTFLTNQEKLIFFSLGSMGSADVDLMNKLVSWMSTLKHKFFVSTGPFHEEIKLAANMIGGKFVNQLAVLKRADLVITHGGNNTFVESLYYGKPMIVLPLFGDQHDNGTRVEDLKIGRSFDPYRVDREDFLTAINSILDDQQLADRMRKIGEDVRSTDSFKLLNEKLIKLVGKS